MPRLPSKEWMIAQVKKKFWKRLSWLSFIFIVALLGDEVIKEGYILNLTDVTNPFAHEFWIVILSIVCLISVCVSKVRRDGDELVE